jgi:uncharacterized protein YdhG (YjbR/CyaY superfamily)
VKQTKFRSHSSAGKRDTAPKDVDEYLAGIPEPASSTLRELREAIRSEVPHEATEVISYRMPAFKSKGKVIVWYAAFSDHCSLFPGGSIPQAFKDELKDYHASKGTIRFPLNKPLPTALVKKIVKARITENESKGKQ